jgi:hypothetical protein
MPPRGPNSLIERQCEEASGCGRSYVRFLAYAAEEARRREEGWGFVKIKMGGFC